MKLRINKNSIRLRLTRTEVEKFEREGRVEESTDFPRGNCLTYGIIHDRAIEIPRVRFDHGQLMIIVPSSMAHGWASTEQVGFSHQINNQNGEPIEILVEKDFQCSGRATENKSDLFPNPKEKSNPQ